jgi:hypothetical protein
MMNDDAIRPTRHLFCLWLIAVPLLVGGIPSSVLAQGYGEQRTLPFRIHGYDRTTQEVYRRQFSGQAMAGSAAGGSSAASGSNSSMVPQKQQSGASQNNVVEYYDYRSTNVTLNGNGSSVSTGGVLNAGQDSTGTSQLLNNQSDSTAGGASALPRTLP